MKSLYFLFLLCIGKCLSAEIEFLQVPKCMYFEGKSSLRTSQVRDVLAAMMGYTVQKDVHFSPLKISSPFCHAEGVVVVSLTGPSKLLSEGFRFQLNSDGDVDETRESLVQRTRMRYLGWNSTFIDLDLGAYENMVTGPQLLRDISLKPEGFQLRYLNMERVPDQLFLQEMQVLKEVARSVPIAADLHNDAADVLWFKSHGFQGLLDTYGAHSEQVAEAKQIFDQVMTALGEVLIAVYDDKVVVAVVTKSEEEHVRKARDAPITDQAKTTPTPPKLPKNLSKNYPEDYAAMFNIFLWTMIAFFLVLALVIVGTCTMDPGKDSIIYRVTSQRMKKDN